ncbi:MAG: sulfatase-like hydrolase/transferase [Candidatus Aminicenantales bacterium]
MKASRSPGGYCFSGWLPLFALFFFSLSSGKPAFPAAPESYNLLLITVDTLRADHLGIYGNAGIRTPNIDRLGRNGLLFSRAYSHVPLTLASHCSLMTGTLPLFHGVRDNGYRLPPIPPTLAEILKKTGYKTGAFVGAFPLDSRFGLDRGFDVYDDLYGSKNAVRDLSFVERRAEDVAGKAIAWMEEHRNERFFAWVHFFDPHAPYEPPSPFKEDYRGREYDGEIAYTDSVIGKLLARIDEWRLTERTIIVLTADHGESLGEHQEATHGIFIYDATLHVPLILFNPKLWPAHSLISSQVGLIDVAPTILELLGLPLASSMQGTSLIPAMKRGKAESGPPQYIESIGAMLDRNWAPLQGIRTEEWKYIEAPQPELYDLKTDPREMRNVLAQNADQARRMREALQSLIGKSSAPAAKNVFSPRDKETLEKLASLGYISGGSAGDEKSRPDPKTMIALDNLFNEAINASETGDLEAADRIYRDVLEKQPTFVVGYEYAAYNLYKMGKLEEAIALLNKATSLNLTTTSLISRLGLYDQETGRLEESIAILEKAVRQDPNYAEAYNYLGVSYFKIGRTADAVEMFKKALALDPDYAMAMNNLGNGYLAAHDYEAAEETYKKAIGIDPNLAGAYNGWGATCYRKGLTDEALRHWEKSLELDPRQPDTSYNLGRVHLRLGHKKEALRYFELFVKTAPPQKYQKDLDEVRGVIDRLKKEIGGKADS